MHSFTIVVLRKEISSLYRNKIFSLLGVLIWLFLLITMAMGTILFLKEKRKVKEANTMFRQQWERQQGNPHDAAHFGTYLFYPVNILGAFDPGLNAYCGTSYRIEAHKQNQVALSTAENNAQALRFGTFGTAFVLQIIFPLLLLFTSCSCISDEREAGTLKMLLAQGIKLSQIAWGKAWAYFLAALAITLPVFVLLLAGSVIGKEAMLAKIMFTGISYLLYYFIVIIIGVNISLISRVTQTALITSLGIWLLLTIFLPKLLTGIADQRYRPMSKATFKNAVEQGFLKGLDGKDPLYPRAERDLKRILKQYHADSTSQLPVDAQAIIMQDNEDYQNRVFDHYHRQIENSFEKQQALLSKGSLIDPFIALRRISMANAGTDFYHHIQFFTQARNYRNHFIRSLNLEQAHHPMKGDAIYKAPPSFFRSIPDFNYKYLRINDLLQLQWLSVCALCCWSGLSALVLQILSKSRT